MNVEVADGACNSAELAQSFTEWLRFVIDGDAGGDGGEELERGLDAAGGGTEPVDRFRRGLLQAVRDCGLECLRLLEKSDDWLRHSWALPVRVSFYRLCCDLA